jgi:hypothetical protein
MSQHTHGIETVSNGIIGFLLSAITVIRLAGIQHSLAAKNCG